MVVHFGKVYAEDMDYAGLCLCLMPEPNRDASPKLDNGRACKSLLCKCLGDEEETHHICPAR
jgi:hypothetical protein